MIDLSSVEPVTPAGAGALEPADGRCRGVGQAGHVPVRSGPGRRVGAAGQGVLTANANQ